MRTLCKLLSKKGAAWMITFALSAFGMRADVVITTLHSFQTPIAGSVPNTLVLGRDGNLYGTTARGGAGGHGTVFKFTTNGVLTTVYSFNGVDTGILPYAGLVQGSDGNFYGTTMWGGTANYGTVFKLTPEGTLTRLHSFWRGSTDMGNNGFYPATELIQGTDGNLYSVTEDGGSRGNGVVFKVSTSGLFTNLHSFIDFSTDGGIYPFSALVQGADRNYYGIAGGLGGSPYRGNIFKITADGVYTNFHSFTGGNDGAGPDRLLLGSDGNFYGTTFWGGTNNYGTIFKFTTNGVCTGLYSFTGGSDGRGPGQLMQGTDGNLYGTTQFGATNGSVFKFTADGVLTILHTFTGGVEGGYLNGLVQVPDGTLYGTTRYGGTAGNGTIFKITGQGTFISLYSFPGATNDGITPVAGLVQGIDGYFYGSTYAGGASSNGTIFKIGPNGAFTSLYSFTNSNTGTNPQATLVQGDDGWLYGTTPGGGTNNFGTVFKISTNGDFASLYSFTGGSDSMNPQAPLVKRNDGNFYGTTYGGLGAFSNTFGTVFKISPSGQLTTLHNFIGGTGITNGTNPKGGLLLGNDGNFYGTTYHGGANTNVVEGTIFSITADGLFTHVYSFTNGYIEGGYPAAGLARGSDGNLYGTTSGSGWGGRVFRVTTNGVFTIPQNIGESVLTRLCQGSDGNSYGTTYSSYSTFTGRIFKVGTNGLFTTLHYFYNNDGGGLSELTQGRDGSFYCTSQNGGAGYGAVLRITIGPVFKAVFKAITLTNSILTLTWSTDVGWTYQLQYKSDLGSGDWINLGNPVTATGSTLSATDSVANAPRRLYRVAVVPQ